MSRGLLLLLLACGQPKPGPGEYEDGVYHCCAEGQGTDCCSGYEQGMCFAYGGVTGACAEAGGYVEGKDICAICCDGLVASDSQVETTEVFDGYPEGCGPGDEPPSLLICIACGDGVCGEGENHCMCPDDCP